MNKNTKQRHAKRHAERVARRTGRKFEGLLLRLESERKGMAQEVSHNIGPDGKRSSVTRYVPAPSKDRSAPYVRTFKAAKTDQ